MPTPIVDANCRFIGAYNEVNARVAQRRQALTLYVSLILSLLAALVALLFFCSSASARRMTDYRLSGRVNMLCTAQLQG